MVEYKAGDILHEDAEALINTVNCVGVMGRGIALQFKKSYPKNFKEYKEACKNGDVKPGKMLVHNTGLLDNPKYIINFPTKRHWKNGSRIEDIESGLFALVQALRALGVSSVAIPPLGCGLGGLDWNDVRPLIEKAMSNLHDVKTIIFKPEGAPLSDVNSPKTNSPQMTSGRAALVKLIARYLDGLLDPFVTLLEVHKLMYFMQVAGEELRLQYKEGPYGPYAENLRHVLNAIEGHMITGYADGGDAPEKNLELVSGAIDKAEKYLKAHRSTLERFERVSELTEGFETSFGMELLATVHWVVNQKKIRSLNEIVEKIHSWNDHKKQFSERQIRIALEHLESKGWIESKTLQPA